MIPRRNEDGWRDVGPFTWKVEREDNHGDRSTTTRFKFTWTARWGVEVKFTRPWR
jgi:hypothetical protein